MHIRKHRQHRQFSMARFYWAIVAIALSVLTVLTACSGSGSQSSGNTGNSAKSDTLTIAVSAATDTLNPVLGGNIDPLLIYEELAYAPLVYLKSDGSYAPGLAAKWGYVGNGNLAYEITLRSGLKFSDGSQLTAAGVKA